MAWLIAFTAQSEDAQNIWINPLYVRSVGENSKGCALTFNDGHTEYVRETVEIVREKCDTWRNLQIESALEVIVKTMTRMEESKR